ncbi:MAG: zf-HC2 domain-containing protein [Elusimicrobia bacterium]|nr:zf-HC2 domain-containing protein [Elusimicrobiota bacterium]
MDHDELRLRLSAYRDGELAEPERAAVAAHLAACPGCRSEARAWEGLARFLLKDRPAPSSAAFTARVMAALPAAEPEPGWAWWAPAFGLAAAMLAFSLLSPRWQTVTTDSLLLADLSADAAAAGTVAPRTAADGDLLGSVLESR